MTLISKLGWLAAATLALFVVATFAGIVSAGPLDPTAPPAPTQRTQNDLLPAWHQTLSATGGCDSERFDCVMAGDVGVLDRETGLVWQRVPPTSTIDFGLAVGTCLYVGTGGRNGWRLATAEELMSLYPLPAGHPFTPGSGNHWTSTTHATNNTLAWQVTATGTTSAFAKSSPAPFWCVRGGYGHDGN